MLMHTSLVAIDLIQAWPTARFCCKIKMSVFVHFLVSRDSLMNVDGAILMLPMFPGRGSFHCPTPFIRRDHLPNSSLTQPRNLLQDQFARFCPFFVDLFYSMVTNFGHSNQPNRLPIPGETWRRILLQEQFARFWPFFVQSCYSMVTGFGRPRRNTDSARPTAAGPSRCYNTRQCVQLPFQRNDGSFSSI